MRRRSQVVGRARQSLAFFAGGVRRRVWLGRAVVVWLFGAATCACAASTYYVDDDDEDCCYGCSCAGSQQYPYCEIEDACECSADGDTVWVLPGTYDDNVNIGCGMGCDLSVRSTDGPDVGQLPPTRC